MDVTQSRTFAQMEGWGMSQREGGGTSNIIRGIVAPCSAGGGRATSSEAAREGDVPAAGGTPPMARTCPCGSDIVHGELHGNTGRAPDGRAPGRGAPRHYRSYSIASQSWLRGKIWQRAKALKRNVLLLLQRSSLLKNIYLKNSLQKSQKYS